MTDAVVVINDLSIEERELDKLTGQLEKLTTTVSTLKTLRKNDMFRFLSKKARNELTEEMVEMASCVQETAKNVFRALKKNKRQRVPEDIVDALLVKNEEQALAISKLITTLNTPSDDDEEKEAA